MNQFDNDTEAGVSEPGSQIVRSPRLRTALFGIQIIGSVLCVAVLAWTIDWRDAGKVFVRANGFTIFLAIGLFTLTHILNIWRWRTLLRTNALTRLHLSAYYGIGLFVNNLLPTGIGGDGLRILFTARSITPSQATLSVISDRLCGFLALLLCAIFASIFGLPASIQERLASLNTNGIYIYYIIASVLTLFLAFLITKKYYLIHFARFFSVQMIHFDRRLAYAIFISIGSILLLTAAAWCCITAVVVVPLNAAFWVVFVTSVALLAPVSLNGLGLQEAIFVSILANYQVTPATALGAALIYRMLGIMFSLVGGGYFALFRYGHTSAK